MGSRAELPSRVNAETKLKAIQLLKDFQNEISSANDIVIVGGGAAGVELAADIKDVHSNKNVTVVHSSNHLLNTFGPGLHNKALNGLRDLGVDVILGGRVSSDRVKDGSILLASGAEISCDRLVCFPLSISFYRQYLIGIDMVYRPASQFESHTSNITYFYHLHSAYSGQADTPDQRPSV